MAGQQSKTIQIGGGTITLTVDVDLFALQGEERDFVFEMIEVFNDYVSGAENKPIPAVDASTIQGLRDSGDLQPKPTPTEKERKSHKKVTPEIVEQALELVKNGSTVSAAAAKVGVHRNSLRNAGIVFGGDSPSGIPEKPLTPGVCRECGGQCSIGGSRCKGCYDKQVAANKEAEEKYKAEVAERKRLRQGRKLKPVKLEPLVEAEPLPLPEVEVPQQPVVEVDAKALASELYNDYLMQCRKLGVKADSSFAEFSADARAMIAWQKDHPGEPYVARYNGKVTTDDIIQTRFGQYESPRG